MLWEMTTDSLSVSFLYICSCAFICGWISDGLVEQGFFGIIGNWLLLLVGSYVGLLVMNILGMTIGGNTVTTIAFAFGGALTLLLTMGVIKGFLDRHA